MRIYRLGAITRRYPFTQELYPFIRRAESACKNRLLSYRGMKRFISLVKTEIPRFENAGDLRRDLAKTVNGIFETHPPEDRTLRLLEDALTAALVDYLYEYAPTPAEAEKTVFAYTAALEETDFEEIYLRYSAVERILCERDLCCYRSCDRESREQIKKEVFRYASARRISDREAAATLTREEIEKRRKRVARVFTCLTAALPVLLFLSALFLCGVPSALLLFLPLYTLSNEIVMDLASLFVPSRPILKSDAEKIERPVLVTVTALFTAPDEAKEQCRRLQKMLLQNPQKNITFALLADLKEAPGRRMPQDAELISALEQGIADLNRRYPGRFALFLRSRTYSPTQGVYMGWERKRGALIELVRFIKGKETSFSTVIAEKDAVKKTSYILTLDADTELCMDGVLTLYRAMTLPENRPVIENGVVVKGYGVLQPRMVASVRSASGTPFAALQTGGGGSDSYRSAVFDFYQSVYGKGAFCGKGMFDVDAFYEVIDGAFPEGRILSHDLLEGTRLRCGYLSELSFTDSCPSNALSFYKRSHRWLRGDFQALPFAFSRLPFEKEKKKNPIDALSRFMIVSNVTRAMTPVFSFAALAAAPVLASNGKALYLLFAFSYLLFPLLTAVLRTLRFVHRRFYSAVLQNVWLAFFAFLWSFISLAFSAWQSLDAATRVLWRSLVSGKKLLEWTTAGEAEKRGASSSVFTRFLLYVRKAAPSLAASVLLLVYGGAGPLRLAALAFLLFPAAETLISLPYKKKKEPDCAGRALLSAYAMESFAFFEKFVTEKEHFLPPDNFQEHPSPVLARRTSPTNIALYLTSVAAMHDLGLMSANEATFRISQTVDTLASLPKYRGHLYNWYSTETLEILGSPYISTVDSGNLALALVTVRKALEEIGGQKAKESAEKIGEMLLKMDFSFLYSERKKLLCIGFDPISETMSPNFYDLLASEARSAYYYAIARGQIPHAAFARLGRPLTARDGHIGLLSFSGTAFEFFMPCLFLPLYENTLLYEALHFALYEQARDRAGGVWGRSESGYFAFDSQMNYQYRAFGARTLALDPSAGRQNVLAPYASFLALMLNPGQAIRNLKKMEARGMKGSCGFYEAVDFTPARVGRGAAVIRSYMAHHVGMSITAIANVCCGNVFVRRLLSDPQMEAATELLKERIPSDAKIPAKKRIKDLRPARLSFSALSSGPAPDGETDAVLVHDKGARICVTGSGAWALAYGRILITPPVGGSSFYGCPCAGIVKNDGSFVSLFAGARFFSGGEAAGYSRICRGGGTEAGMTATDGNVFVLSFSGRARENDAGFLFSLPLALCREGEFRTHPAYPGLFVFGEYLEKEKILLYTVRSRTHPGAEYCLAAAVSANLPYEFAMRCDDLPPEEDLLAAFSSRAGALRKPHLFLRAPLKEGGEFLFELVLAFSDKRDEALKKAAAYRDRASEKGIYAGVLREKKRQKHFSNPRPDKQTLDAVSLLLCGVIGKKTPVTGADCRKIEELWRFGISGDLPVFSFYLQEKPLSANQKRILQTLLFAHSYLLSGGVYCDLVFLRKESEPYFSPAKNELEKLISESVGKSCIGKKGGVHLVFEEDAPAVLTSFSKVSLSIERDCIRQDLRKRLIDQIVLPPPPRAPRKRSVRKETHAESGGAFCKEGFAVNTARRIHAPFSMIYASRQFGTLVTDRSPGFTWLRNSGELRLTPFSGSETEDLTGEKLMLTCESAGYDLCREAQKVFFGFDCAVYTGAAGGVGYEVKIGVHEKLPVKLILVRLENRTQTRLTVKLDYQIEPVIGRTFDGLITVSHTEEALVCKRTALYDDHDFALYLAPSSHEAQLSPGEQKPFVFRLGSFNLKNDRCFYRVLRETGAPEDLAKAYAAYRRSYEPYLSRFETETGRKANDLFVSRFLPYQVLTARLFGRTGFYQPGGAYGFRDQLQDALSMLDYDPDLLRIQLFRAAAHQYLEGDVQHWWHRVEARGRCDAGVRTDCSDDLLWLPYAYARYLDCTGKAEIGECRIAYLSSPPKAEGRDRYERPEKTCRKERLSDHCLRALDRVLSKRGTNGLCSIGSGDWNDGFSKIGGQSVWLTQFLALTIGAFRPYADAHDRARLENARAECLSAIARAYEKGRYLRAFFDDGTPLGAAGSPYCRIDLLPQSFAVFLGAAGGRAAILQAYDRLWDEKNGLFKLFDPPYGSETPFPGYLGGYCPGFRENGGQYTHAAVWGAMALLRAGENEKGARVLYGISPALRSEKDFSSYALEPYAMAGDLYCAEGFEGRGGWSLYTGSAGWYLAAFIGELIGYHEKDGAFSLHPRLSALLPSFSVTIRKNATVYRVQILSGHENRFILDEKSAENRFIFDGKTHKLKIVLAK